MDLVAAPDLTAGGHWCLIRRRHRRNVTTPQAATTGYAFIDAGPIADVSGNPSYGVLAMDLGHTLHGSAVFEGVVYLDTAGARPSERARACAVGQWRGGWPEKGRGGWLARLSHTAAGA